MQKWSRRPPKTSVYIIKRNWANLSSSFLRKQIGDGSKQAGDVCFFVRYAMKRPDGTVKFKRLSMTKKLGQKHRFDAEEDDHSAVFKTWALGELCPETTSKDTAVDNEASTITDDTAVDKTTALTAPPVLKTPEVVITKDAVTDFSPAVGPGARHCGLSCGQRGARCHSFRSSSHWQRGCRRCSSSSPASCWQRGCRRRSSSSSPRLLLATRVPAALLLLLPPPPAGNEGLGATPPAPPPTGNEGAGGAPPPPPPAGNEGLSGAPPPPPPPTGNEGPGGAPPPPPTGNKGLGGAPLPPPPPTGSEGLGGAPPPPPPPPAGNEGPGGAPPVNNEGESAGGGNEGAGGGRGRNAKGHKGKRKRAAAEESVEGQPPGKKQNARKAIPRPPPPVVSRTSLRRGGATVERPKVAGRLIKLGGKKYFYPKGTELPGGYSWDDDFEEVMEFADRTILECVGGGDIVGVVQLQLSVVCYFHNPA
ncbi:hypothetical protein MSAN_02365100 [Mycena sanguinolenta]|uniref:Uncharacterized protein n=1 Tax=Mycena sanguinolenta TaxID=230812 RepID=A0A8H6X5C5_9AGAR|nr:hypothetical protein MSAN_02365100 [Mycena sanguinolenta]